MAQLILTDEERKASWANLSDEDIGKFMRKSMFSFEADDIQERETTDEKFEPWFIKLGLLFLVNKLADENVTTASYQFGGVNNGDRYNGNWQVELERLDDSYKGPSPGTDRKVLEVRANKVSPGARFTTCWSLLCSAMSVLFLGRLRLMITKEMKIPSIRESRG